jgi:hypothetical protein
VVEGNRLKTYIANQYQALFLTQAEGDLEEMTSCVQQYVTREMNELLMAPYSGDEVWKALEGIGDLKASGADDIPAIFYKKNLGADWRSCEGEGARRAN